MTTATTLPLPPPWLLEVLRRCAPPEQDAIDAYRATLRQHFDDINHGRLCIDGLLRRWGDTLTDLEAGACGSPQFDAYIATQHNRVETVKTQRKWQGI